MGRELASGLAAPWRVVLVVRDDTPVAGGNWQSAARLAGALCRRGIEARVARLSERPAADLVHAFHAWATAEPLLNRGVDPARLVVTWTGTDLTALDSPLGQDRVATLSRAAQHTVLTRAARDQLAAAAPGWRVSHIPPGVDTGQFRPGPPADAPSPLSLLLVGAGRPVKRPLWAVDLVSALWAAGIEARLTVTGPPRDLALWAALTTRAQIHPWLTLVEEVEPAAMPGWYRRADVVLNVSETEGLSNALLEGMASGVPPAVVDIPGNRALVEAGHTGLVFSTQQEFVAGITELVRDPGLRGRLGAAARTYVMAHHNVDREADAFSAVYRRVAS